jgi:hypothetical protein
LPKTGAGYAYRVDWGDGSPIEYETSTTAHPHTYDHS